MEKQHPYQRYFIKVKPVLRNKVEELRLLGLGDVNENEVWECLVTKKWKKPDVDIHIHEIVQDILTLSNSQYMTYKTIEAYKGPNLFKELSSEDLNQLLKD
ncbi:post-transcriptional regulator [Peribacillus loiseleuriae]|uniref:post-transcriptional regulator n=1 Tax=Peribacillus loiseleuriae TaxID=1679170 RepID=UPI0038042FBF